MLHSNYIQILLNLKDVSIINFFDSSVTIQLPRKPHLCPCCHHTTNSVHDYRLQKIHHLTYCTQSFSIFISKRRYRCPFCNKRFIENISFLGKYQRMTTSFIKFILSQISFLKSASSIAKDNKLSVSTVLRLIDKISTKTVHLPEIISIDEFKGNAAKKKFQFVINDPIAKKTLDVLPTRRVEYPEHYFLKFSYKDRCKVKYVVMDMNKSFKQVNWNCFPNAKIVVDKFHICRYVQWALENIRKEVQKSFGNDRRKYFKTSRWILLKRNKKLKKEEDRKQLEMMLTVSEKLREAYELKEAFYELMEKEKDKKEAIKKWIKIEVAYNLKEYNKVAEMMYRWFNPIVKGFETGYTNGFTEGKNNKIKVLKRISFGVRRFDRFRKRILYLA